MSDQRLSRMEDKLDKLSEAIISMARMEERLVSVDKRMDKVDDVFKKFDDRMDDIERQAIPNKKKPKRQSKHQKAMKSKWLE